MIAVEIDDLHTNEIIDEKNGYRRSRNHQERYGVRYEYRTQTNNRLRKKKEVHLFCENSPFQGCDKLVGILQRFHHRETRNLHTRQPKIERSHRVQKYRVQGDKTQNNASIRHDKIGNERHKEEHCRHNQSPKLINHQNQQPEQKRGREIVVEFIPQPVVRSLADAEMLFQKRHQQCNARNDNDYAEKP